MLVESEKDKIIEEKEKEIIYLKKIIISQKDQILKIKQQAEFLMNESKKVMWDCHNVGSSMNYDKQKNS